MPHSNRPPFKPSLQRLGTLTFVGLFGVLGGCASSFRYNPDDAPPPPAEMTPTTMPSRAEVQSTLSRAGLGDFAQRVYDYVRGDVPSAQATAMEDSKLPDRRRMGINELVDHRFGQVPPYTTRYDQIAHFDADPSVRATAVRALNVSRDASVTGTYIASLADDSSQVRLEGAKALANIPDPAAIQPLLKVFRNTAEDVDVRIATADALRHYRSLEVARALVDVLADREFGLAWQARRSLRNMTGADEYYDQAAWLKLVTSGDQPLS